MTIWADGDSLQAEIRGLICRRANNEARAAAAGGRDARYRAVFVAAVMPPLELGPGVETRLALPEDASAGDYANEGKKAKAPEGAADDLIAEFASPGDLAVTRDLPLVERLGEKGLRVLNDRGEVFTAENARERRSLRDRAEELRALGLAPPSPRGRSWGSREFKAFADALDRELARR